MISQIWQRMQQAGLPQSFDEALERVRASPSSSEGFAFLGKITGWGYLPRPSPQIRSNLPRQFSKIDW